MSEDPIKEAVARAMFDWSHDEGWERGELETKRIYMEDARAAIRALYGALEKEGWQVVPRTATREMALEMAEQARVALNSGVRGDSQPYSDHSIGRSVWTAGAIAAPKPPGAG